MIRTLALTAALLLGSATAFADTVAGRAGDIAVSAPWSRATAPTAPNGAAYLTLSNEGSAPDRLLAVRSPAAATVELHAHTADNGVMRMRPVEAIEVAPGSPTVLQPGGLHIMLMGLKQPLKPGERLPLTLVFERAGTVTVEAPIGPPGATVPPGGAHHGGMHHGGHGGHGGPSHTH